MIIESGVDSRNLRYGGAESLFKAANDFSIIFFTYLPYFRYETPSPE